MGAHQHTHEDDSYYLDQMCMVTLSGAFGGICLALYFWKTDMLTRLLGPQFHVFVLASGFTLIALALLRALSLWLQVGRGNPHSHDHGHSHEDRCNVGASCQHDDHDHAHGHESLTHQQEHHHEDHAHHDHGPEDHDHNWAPWRYVVLLIPVIFFLLGLPNKGPKAVEMDSTGFFATDVAKEVAGLVSPGSPGWTQLIYIGYLGNEQVKGDVKDWTFKDLSAKVALAATSSDSAERDYWKDMNVRVIGMYSPSRQSEREFRLVRFKLTCCVADAIQLNLPIVSRESIRDIKGNSWVRVTGHVEFRKRLDEIVPIIVVSGRQAVEPWAEDSNPYN